MSEAGVFFEGYFLYCCGYVCRVYISICIRIRVSISIIVGFVICIHVHIHIPMIIYISIDIGSNISISINIRVTIRMDRRRTISMYIGGSIRVRCGRMGIGIKNILIHDDVVIAPYFLLVQHVLI